MMNALWSIPSGYLIALLAFVVFVPTLIPPEKFKPLLKGIFAAAALLLVAGELSVLRHSQKQAETDRNTQDEAHKQEITKLLTHFTTIETLLTDDIKINSIRRQSTGTATPTLKSRALDLSDELLQFLVNRQVSPGYGQAGMGEGGFGGTDTSTDEYQKKTVEMYRAAFHDRVVAMRDALAKQGLTSDQLDQDIHDPANAYSIRTIAQQIAALAEKVR
jgi:hypothetical protein